MYFELVFSYLNIFFLVIALLFLAIIIVRNRLFYWHSELILKYHSKKLDKIDMIFLLMSIIMFFLSALFYIYN